MGSDFQNVLVGLEFDINDTDNLYCGCVWSSGSVPGS